MKMKIEIEAMKSALGVIGGGENQRRVAAPARHLSVSAFIGQRSYLAGDGVSPGPAQPVSICGRNLVSY